MKKELVEGLDYYINDQGLYVFTAHYLKNRGYCCGSGCKHCPYTKAEFEAAVAKKRRNKLWLD
jgi:urocanate hydratase